MKCFICTTGVSLVALTIFTAVASYDSADFFKTDLNSILQTLVYLYIGTIFTYYHLTISAKKSNLSALSILFLLELSETIDQVLKENNKRFGDNDFDAKKIMITFKRLANKTHIVIKAIDHLGVGIDAKKLKLLYFEFKADVTSISGESNFQKNDIIMYEYKVQKSFDMFKSTIDEMRLAIISI